MEFPRVSSWIVPVCAVIVAILLSVASTTQPQWAKQLSGTSLQQLIADGGGPAPPYPPQTFGELVADGGGPAPPYPPSAVFGSLIADGGGPAPPYPPSPVFAV